MKLKFESFDKNINLDNKIKSLIFLYIKKKIKIIL